MVIALLYDVTECRHCEKLFRLMTTVLLLLSAQHIHRILSASRENIDEARRILPDDVKSIFLPQGSFLALFLLKAGSF